MLRRLTIGLVAALNVTSIQSAESKVAPPLFGWDQQSTSLVLYNGEPLNNSKHNELAEFSARIVNKTSRCMGVLIQERHVLTAAHCFDKHKSPVVGFYTDSTLTNQEEIAVTRWSLHPSYINKGSTISYFDYSNGLVGIDLAVLELRRAPKWARPVWLRKASGGESTFSYGDRFVIGVHNSKALGSSKGERMGAIKFKAFKRYNEDYSSYISRVSKQGACGGDSGGPIVVKYRDSWYLESIYVGGSQNPDWGKCGNYNIAVKIGKKHSAWIDETVRSLGGEGVLFSKEFDPSLELQVYVSINEVRSSSQHKGVIALAVGPDYTDYAYAIEDFLHRVPSAIVVKVLDIPPTRSVVLVDGEAFQSEDDLRSNEIGFKGTQLWEVAEELRSRGGEEFSVELINGRR